MTLIERMPPATQEQMTICQAPHELFGITSSYGSVVSPELLIKGLFPQASKPGDTLSSVMVQRDAHDVVRLVQDDVDVHSYTPQQVCDAVGLRGSISRMMTLVPSEGGAPALGQTTLQTHLSWDPQEAPVGVAQWSERVRPLTHDVHVAQHIASAIRSEGGSVGWKTKECLLDLTDDCVTLVMTGTQLYAFRSSDAARPLYYAITHDFHSMLATDASLFEQILDQASYRTIAPVPPKKLLSFHASYVPHQQ